MPLPALLPLAAKALPAALSFAGGRRSARGGGAPSGTENRFLTAMDDYGRAGSRLNAEAERRSMSFDPRAFMRETIEGTANEFRREMRDDLDDLAGRAAGNGRLNTGFFDADQGTIVRRSNERLQDVIAQTAGQAGQMTLQNNAQLFGMGREAGQQYLDLMSGQLDREQAANNARTQTRNARLGAFSNLAGSFLGSPTGGRFMDRIGGMLRRPAAGAVVRNPTAAGMV